MVMAYHRSDFVNVDKIIKKFKRDLKISDDFKILQEDTSENKVGDFTQNYCISLCIYHSQYSSLYSEIKNLNHITLRERVRVR